MNDLVPRNLRTFDKYVSELERQAVAVLSASGEISDFGGAMAAAVDGGPAANLQATVPAEFRRSSGIFFSGHDLAQKAVPQHRAAERTYFDPACGVGDLLLAAATKLPIHPTVDETLNNWGRSLYGLDLHDTFVRATKARLVLLASLRGATNYLPRSDATFFLREIFPGIRQANGLTEDVPSTVTDIVLNPPFTTTVLTQPTEWSSGSVSTAALFVIKYLEDVDGGVRLTAILPDVLRSGTRYAAWRERVERLAIVEDVQLHGRFATADVDVFLLRLRKRTRATLRLSSKRSFASHGTKLASDTVGTHFKVTVGPVVPHRHIPEGKLTCYLNVHDAPPNATIDGVVVKRRWRGPTVMGPLVVVRRTSSPHDQRRAIATFVKRGAPLAIENHLLILKPRRGGAAECRRLMRVLAQPATQAFLNQRMRCRHLTVQAVSEIAWLP